MTSAPPLPAEQSRAEQSGAEHTINDWIHSLVVVAYT